MRIWTSKLLQYVVKLLVQLHEVITIPNTVYSYVPECNNNWWKKDDYSPSEPQVWHRKQNKKQQHQTQGHLCKAHRFIMAFSPFFLPPERINMLGIQSNQIKYTLKEIQEDTKKHTSDLLSAQTLINYLDIKNLNSIQSVSSTVYWNRGLARAQAWPSSLHLWNIKLYKDTHTLPIRFK